MTHFASPGVPNLDAPVLQYSSVITSGVVANLELGNALGSVYSSRPSVGGNSGAFLGGTTRRRSLRPEGPKIEA